MAVLELMELQNEQFSNNMAKVIKRFEKLVLQLTDGLSSVDGKFTTSASNLNNARIVGSELQQALTDAGYWDLADRTLKQNNRLMNLRHDELKTLLGRKSLGKIDTRTLKALNKLKFEGMTDIGDRQLIAIQEAIFNSVNLGLPISTLRNELEGKLGTLSAHADTYIRTAKREFAQRVEDNTAKQIGFGDEKDDIWEYSPLITQENSHPECVWAVDKQYFTNADKQEFNAGGGFSHSEPRWNCVHIFEITNVTFDEAFG